MGQLISVKVRQGTEPNVRIFDINRSLTSMEIEKYISVEGTTAGRPPDVLAKRLLESGATAVTIYSNVITIEAPADGWAALEPIALDIIEHLFEYYGDDAGYSPSRLALDGVEIVRAEPS